jgi:hypothetical protein
MHPGTLKHNNRGDFGMNPSGLSWMGIGVDMPQGVLASPTGFPLTLSLGFFLDGSPGSLVPVLLCAVIRVAFVTSFLSKLLAQLS